MQYQPVQPVPCPAPADQFANPWGQPAVAWTNGQTVHAPLTPVPVRKRTPRTQFIVLTGRLH